jgi:hypothetical protein
MDKKHSNEHSNPHHLAFKNFKLYDTPHGEVFLRYNVIIIDIKNN